MFENLSLSLQGVWAHKLRSFLTMLGIIIGIASIITIVATIKGTNEQIKENLVGAGTNAVVVSLYQNDSLYYLGYQSPPEGIATISEETRQELASINRVEAASLFCSRSNVDGAYYKNNAFSGQLAATGSSAGAISSTAIFPNAARSRCWTATPTRPFSPARIPLGKRWS